MPHVAAAHEPNLLQPTESTCASYSSVLRCPAALITQPLQAGGWVPTPSGGVGLQRTGSGRLLQPAEKKKRRGAVLRLFDMLRCAWGGRVGCHA